jgi:hypothetical protein
MKHYVPELDYYFKKYWDEHAEIKLEHSAIPEPVSNADIFPTGSFLQLLFDNDYNYPTYSYMFRKANVDILPKATQERMRSLGITYCYLTETCDSTAVLYNVFLISDDEATMLDLLHRYRLGNSVDLNTVDFNSLEKPLAILIYLYLEFMLTYNFEKVMSYEIVSLKEDTLDNLFELYLYNEIHSIVKNWSFLEDSKNVSLYPIKQRIQVTSDMITQKKALISFEPLEELYIFKNGAIQDNSLFEIVSDGTSRFYISWLENPNLFTEGDTLLVETYTDQKIQMRPIPEEYR